MNSELCNEFMPGWQIFISYWKNSRGGVLTQLGLGSMHREWAIHFNLKLFKLQQQIHVAQCSKQTLTHTDVGGFGSQGTKSLAKRMHTRWLEPRLI